MLVISFCSCTYVAACRSLKDVGQRIVLVPVCIVLVLIFVLERLA